MRTVGLYSTDTRIYYVDPTFTVVNDINNGGGPIIVKRTLGDPTQEELQTASGILKQLNMYPIGASSHRSDGLWYHQIEERR